MPSFDVVSRVNMQEVVNAVQQAEKEVSQRYDFKGSKSTVTLENKLIKLVSDDDYRLKALLDVVKGKLIRRGVSLKNVKDGKIEPALGGLMKMDLEIKEGIDQENAKTIVKEIKGSKLKVQAQIQGDELRISGKKKDELQETITMIKAMNLPLEFQFINFRD